MPVPLPSAAEVTLGPPDAEEVRIIAGGVAGAVEVNGELSGLQRMLIEAMVESMTGYVVPARRVPRLGPQEFARALAGRDSDFRQRMLQFMLMCSLVLTPLPDAVVDRVESYARELGVDNDMLRVAQRYAHGSLGLALIDFNRSGYTALWDPAHAQALHVSGALVEAWAQSVSDPALATKWAELRELPDETLGRQVANFYDARGFTFPGTPNSAPPLLAQHDWVHVLAGYGSTVESELEVFALISRANDDPRAFSLLAMVISLFETGYLATGAGLFEYDRGHLSHDGMAVRMADAMRRGALCAAAAGHGADLLQRDWFADAARPLEEVRDELGLVPKSERAVDAGSVTAWQKGGISPFQYDCGRESAARAGRDYESYGAEPAGV